VNSHSTDGLRFFKRSFRISCILSWQYHGVAPQLCLGFRQRRSELAFQYLG